MRTAHALALFALSGALACTGKPADPPSPGSAALLDPSKATATAPDLFEVKLQTTQGEVVIEVHREWAPQGADRFYNLVKAGFYDDVAFFRAIDGFMVQFGMHGDPAVTRAWNAHPIPDDPVTQSNRRGYVTFAKKNSPDSRTTQIFVNFRDNANLDQMGFAPFGQVTQGMDLLDGVYKGYGEGAPMGKGPDQMKIEQEGNAYLKRDFPKLDWVKTATLVGP